jgi:DNA-binding MarR family transcriptional regulator
MGEPVALTRLTQQLLEKGWIEKASDMRAGLRVTEAGLEAMRRKIPVRTPRALYSTLTKSSQRE